MQSIEKSAPTGCKIMGGVDMNYYNEIKNKIMDMGDNLNLLSNSEFKII